MTTRTVSSVIYQWWRALHGELETAARSRNKDAAELRRATTLADVALLPAYHTLRLELVRHGHTFVTEHKVEHLTAIAKLCAHIREDDHAAKTVGQALGRLSSSNKPMLSELRFTKIVRSKTMGELATQLRRAIGVLGYKMPVEKLIEDLMRWDKDTRRIWATGYYDCTTLSA